MTVTYKVLAQSNPSANTNTDAYTVGASTSAIVSTIQICNTDSAAATFRIAIRPAGASIVTKHYLAFDVALAGNDSIALTIGVTLATTDVVTVRASTANVAFNIFGQELS